MNVKEYLKKYKNGWEEGNCKECPVRTANLTIAGYELDISRYGPVTCSTKYLNLINDKSVFDRDLRSDERIESCQYIKEKLLRKIAKEFKTMDTE